MKQFLSIALFLGLVFVVQGAAQTQSAPAKTRKAVAFERYDQSYFIRNDVELDDNGSFLVLTSQNDFNLVFGTAVTMRNGKFLPKNFFDTHMVLVTNKRGNFLRKFEVKQVVQANGKLYLWYTTTDGQPGSGGFNAYMSVGVPKGDYQEIVFVENGKKIATVPYID
jgi:hypothetical protein